MVGVSFSSDEVLPTIGVLESKGQGEENENKNQTVAVGVTAAANAVPVDPSDDERFDEITITIILVTLKELRLQPTLWMKTELQSSNQGGHREFGENIFLHGR